MAGVALVADAAEQLERFASENCSFGQGSLALQNAGCSFSVAGVCSHQVGAAVLQAREKLKLQLFPMDEDTRRMLEKDAHNPFLELTLSARKRISSVLEHLNRKWGLNTRGSTELLLLPYSIQQRDIEKCQRWSIKDADFTAADVHAAVGNPSVFRLRYGWFSGGKLVAGFSDSPRAPGFDNGLAEEFVATDKEIIACDSSKCNSTNICVSKQPEVSSSNYGLSPAAIASVEPTAQIDHCLKPKGDVTESSSKSAFCIAELTKDSFEKQQDLADSATRNNCSELLAVEWADSLTNISVGDLLLEASEVPSPQQNTLCIQHNPISCDSFDAAVAAHSYRSQVTGLSAQAPIVSLWNAEETCDEFSFRKASALKAKVMNLCPNNLQGSTCNMNSSGFLDCCPEDLGESSSSDDPLPDEPESALRQNDDPVKDSLLTDLYWPDSLGSLGHLDLDLPFPRYVTQDLCFSGSVCHSSFNLMIGNSLDAFQSGSFLGNDRKDIDCVDGVATVVDDRMITEE
ncbi:hypothetical protein HPP92_011996 [Vanilla planifolia]|uniref:TSL-kinase interacting protein 1 n=1 Tax=Vanilla planifolia TaxID=51239 RepID=A0A835RDF8_VANPL|nr:hypothetical protein HPP92_011996 [Vanilla planifolia]